MSDSLASSLFSPVTLGRFALPTRVVMAPLTRRRADADGVPGDLMVEHYRQRAGMGLIVTEGTYPSHESQSYVDQPGIASDEQAAGWARVADAVHAEGGRIVMQIMHGGRTAHPDITGGLRVLGPSAIAIEGEVHTPRGKQPAVVPEAMTLDDIAATIEGHAAAARRAIDAGLDGVEIHSANGYLLQQFLAPSSNTRTDVYGGSPENRARFTADVTEAVVAEVGADRVGLRISPQHNIQDVIESDDADAVATYDALLDRVAPLGLAYLSILRGDPTGPLVEHLAERFGGPVVANSGFATITELPDAEAMINAPFINAVAVGREAIANPDLVERWEKGLPLNEIRPQFFYEGGATGYTDYPFAGE